MDLRALTNIGDSLRLAAKQFPRQIAIAEPIGKFGARPIRYRKITFAELDRLSDQISLGVRRHGVTDGAKISLMIPPGIDFVAWVFGLFKASATAILIDPGMGRKNMMRCLADAQPDGLAGISIAHALRVAMGRRLPQCRLNFNVGQRWLPLAIDSRHFDSKISPADQEIGSTKRSAEDAAAIIFTTGSTGPPKGVLYRHRHFIEQTVQIRDYFKIEPGGVDVSGFPLFALFNTGMGTTTVFPRMDATRPAKINPECFIDAVEHFQANQSFGSPALWNTVSRYCERKKLKLPTLRRVLTAGAPVAPLLLQRVRNSIADAGEVFTPYGATEALPVACIESRIVLDETSLKTKTGQGICVGKSFPHIQWRVIEISDNPIDQIASAGVVSRGQIGELIVSGPVVTDRYVTRVDANALHKIIDGDRFWHRMGDVGYLDDDVRFWFCGRKSHRVTSSDRTLFTIPCEAIFNNHPSIYRSALVGIGPRGSQTPALIAEPWPEHWPRSSNSKRQLLSELRTLAEQHELTRSIKHFFLMKALPVDIRHNSKIFREQLSEWAARRLGVKN